jgi:hypothetical protein
LWFQLAETCSAWSAIWFGILMMCSLAGAESHCKGGMWIELRPGIRHGVG